MAEKTKSVGRPLKYPDPQHFKQKVEAYFEECKLAKEQPFLTELCLYLEILNETLSDYEKRPEYSATIKKARLEVLVKKQKFLYTSKNVAGAIFDLKCNHGWTDAKDDDSQTEPVKVSIEIVDGKAKA